MRQDASTVWQIICLSTNTGRFLDELYPDRTELYLAGIAQSIYMLGKILETNSYNHVCLRLISFLPPHTRIIRQDELTPD